MSSFKSPVTESWKAILDLKKTGYTAVTEDWKRYTIARSLQNCVEQGVFAESKRLMREFGDGAPQILREYGEAPSNVMGASSSVANAGPIDTFDPILISLIRRSMPNLIAYDFCGVQPMTGPTGLIFALRTRYGPPPFGPSQSSSAVENFYNEVDTGFASAKGALLAANSAAVGGAPGLTDAGLQALLGLANTVAGGANGNMSTLPLANTNASSAYNATPGLGEYNYEAAMLTAAAENLGYSYTGNNIAIPEMGLTIDKTTVTAKERALKAEYSIEMAQDLKAIHGLDIEAELTNLLSAELLAEINREIIRTIVVTASRGGASGTTTAGVFDLDADSDGRWLIEKFKGLMFRLDLEANAIAKNTRRGKGNVILCSSNVASALNAAGVLQFTPRLDSNNLVIDDTGNTFVGVLNGKYKVFIDPYCTGDYMVIGYKGNNAFDAGIFYCPYVPLQLLKAVDPVSLQPKIGFKTRYGVVANPFAQGLTIPVAPGGALTQDTNLFYNRLIVKNLM